MTRVSENSTSHSINFSVAKAKSRLEDLQIKGSNLKRIQKPSDDPVGNVELLQMRSKNTDSDQYIRNLTFAKMNLNVTENALEELYNIAVKAKEIAVGQASDLYNKEIRTGIAKEIRQLRNQAIGIGNRRFGNRYIFSGHKTLTRPFDTDGRYFGDKGKINIEIDKDFFVPINFTGTEIFLTGPNKSIKEVRPLEDTPFDHFDGIEKRADPAEMPKEFPDELIKTESKPSDRIDRDLAGKPKNPANPDLSIEAQNQIDDTLPKDGLLSDLKSLENALITNNTIVIQTMLERLDKDIDGLIQLRTELGSVFNTIETAENTIESKKVFYDAYKSKIEDADVAELYSDLAKQQNVLNATYKVSNNLISKSLLDFIR